MRGSNAIYRGLWLAVAAAALALQAATPAAAADVFVNAAIVASETWTNDNEYILTQVIYVTNGATLTIEPGTVIRGEMESAPGANDPGALVITRGSKIRALGTIYDPVVFTDLNDDNIGENAGTPPYDSALNALGLTGQWGGVILLGYGYVANDTAAMASQAREVQIEGLTAAGGLGFYGNCAGSPLAATNSCDDDDSGEMQYVSIRYGGFNLAANNEINGLTLGGVGRETDLSFIEVFQNKDDGVEFFGGAASVKNVVIANVGDDSVDYDEGWRGKGQFVFAMQGIPGADRSDKGGEHDGGNSPDQSLPRATPAIYNATYVGLGQDYNGASKPTNTTMVLRDNAGGRYFNSFFADFGGAAALIEGACGEAGTSGERAQTPYVIDNEFNLGPQSDFELQLEDNTWWCLGAELAGTPLVPALAADAVTAGGANRAHCDPGLFDPAVNDYLTCADPLPIRLLDRFPNPDPTRPDPVVEIDPRPVAGGALLGSDRTPPADGFYMPAAYKGAFHSNWAAGYWTAMTRLGYFPECDPAMNPEAVPNEVTGLLFSSEMRMFWEAQPFNIRGYRVLRTAGTDSTAAATFDGINGEFVEELDYDLEAEDADTPAQSEAYFYLVYAANDCGDGSRGLASDGSERDVIVP